MDYEQLSAAEWEIPLTFGARKVPSPLQSSFEDEYQCSVGLAESKVGVVPLTPVEVPEEPRSYSAPKQRVKASNPLKYSSPSLQGFKPTHTRAGKPSAGGSTFILPDVYGSYRSRVINEGRAFLKLKGPGKDLDIFIEISRRSNTYVKKPENHDNTIRIFGSRQNVQLARGLLTNLFERCTMAAAATSASKTTKSYAQMQANIVTVQNIPTAQQHKNEPLLNTLRRAPNPSPEATRNHQMVFLWPSEKVSARQILGPDLEKLDFLRLRYRCFIYLSKESEDAICVSGPEKEILQQTITRLETKWQELIASSTIKTKLYLLSLPVGDQFVSRIVMQPIDHLAQPCFHLTAANQASHDIAGRWDEMLQSRDDSTLRSAVKKSLCCVPLIQNTLSMRVNFGSLLFERYRNPHDPQNGYSVAEFSEMISHELTKGRLVPPPDIDLEVLVNRIYKASHLFDLEEQSPDTFSGSSLHHTVKVEFDAIGNEFLQLEVGFRAVGGRHERTKSRWVQSQAKGEFAENTPLLQANVLGAKGIDWQLEIRERKVLDAQQKSLAMSEFDHQVRLRDDVMQEDLLAEPNRRAMLPDGFPVSRLVEKAALQYRIKGTEYILEVARFDVYIKQPNTGTSNMSFEPPVSFWGLFVYGVNWDDNLAKLAEAKEVQQMGFSSVMDPFFSQKVDDENKAGFQGFIKLIREIVSIFED